MYRYRFTGFGDSDKPWDGYNYDTMADDVKAILDSLDLQDVTLAGFSMGGAVSTRYISRHHGAHIEKLVLISSASLLIN
jgi:non-heme chloroperoxidase